jgi:hypothetical protein
MAMSAFASAADIYPDDEKVCFVPILLQKSVETGHEA